MKITISITLLTLLTLTLLHAEELEKEIQYLGNDGTTETHRVVCVNGKSDIVSIDNVSKEMSVGSENLGRVTFSVAVKKICS